MIGLLVGYSLLVGAGSAGLLLWSFVRPDEDGDFGYTAKEVIAYKLITTLILGPAVGVLTVMAVRVALDWTP